MNLFHEWPLVLFTLTVQAAVGLYVALLGIGALDATGDPPGSQQARIRPPSLLVGTLMAVALLTSLLHLGTPLNALRTLTNLDQSWLSREILLALLFLGLWGLDYMLRRGPNPGLGTRPAVAWTTGAVGIILIWVMARIYMIPARPLWDHWLTAAGFFLTTLLLGVVILAALAEGPGMDPRKSDEPTQARTTLILVGLGGVMAQLVATLAHPLTREVTTYSEGPHLVALRILLLLAGAIALALPLLRRPPWASTSTGKMNPRYGSAAPLLLLGASEIVGRMLFYALGTVNPF